MITGLMIEMAYEAEQEYLRVAVYPNADRLNELDQLTAIEAGLEGERAARSFWQQLGRPFSWLTGGAD